MSIELEHHILDRITVFLDLAANRKGRTLREISKAVDFSIGRVEEVCRKSVAVLRQRPRNSHLWFNDWTDCEPSFRPVRKKGRPSLIRA
jgi:hypothetical protein